MYFFIYMYSDVLLITFITLFDASFELSFIKTINDRCFSSIIFPMLRNPQHLDALNFILSLCSPISKIPHFKWVNDVA